MFADKVVAMSAWIINKIKGSALNGGKEQWKSKDNLIAFCILAGNVYMDRGDDKDEVIVEGSWRLFLSSVLRCRQPEVEMLPFRNEHTQN